jgi:hypothetical protein
MKYLPWLIAVLALGAAGFSIRESAFKQGQSYAEKECTQEAANAQAQAIGKRLQKEIEIQKLDDPDLQRRLDRWMRSD